MDHKRVPWFIQNLVIYFIPQSDKFYYLSPGPEQSKSKKSEERQLGQGH